LFRKFEYTGGLPAGSNPPARVKLLGFPELQSAIEPPQTAHRALH